MLFDFAAATGSLVETMLRAQQVEYDEIAVAGNDVNVTLRRRESFEGIDLPQTVHIDYIV